MGRRVKKEFQGKGAFFGLVQAYEPTTGFFKIVYDDGDSEELELSEFSSLVLPTEHPPPQRKRGRPKKRRRICNKGKDNDDSVIGAGACENLLDRKGDSNLNLNGGLDLNDDAFNQFKGDDNGGGGGGGGATLQGLDLNEGVNLELDEGLYLDKGVTEECSGANKEMIDLNLDASGDFENSSDAREERQFDLNLQLIEDDGRVLKACEGRFEELMEDDIKGNLIVNKQNKYDTPQNNFATGVDTENVAPVSSQKKTRGRKRKDASSNNIEVAEHESLKENSGTRNMKLEFESRDGITLQNGSGSVDYDNEISETVVRGRRGRKRKELLNDDITLPSPETGLRRSSRRANRAAFSGPDQVISMSELDGINHQLSSPAISVISDEKIVVAAPGKSANCDTLPSKVELPPSSCGLDFTGAPVFDFVSVYAFLRSFSTLLFLSPFELEDFVACVKCNDSTLLFDSIHVSLLRPLRKHLESLSDEGSMSASDCLRY